MSGHTAARCDDVTPVSRLVKDGMIFVTASKIVAVPLAQTEQELRDMVCRWESHTGTVDSVTVDVLGRDIAVAAWLYHDQVKLKSGEIKRYKGSALMTLVRSVDGWKITSTMAANE
jgi:ketosteroid isomerase-like protein